MQTIIRNNKLAPCGVYCGACPSFGVSCFGCASEDRGQKRTSKWGCRIRTCCYENRKLTCCVQCEDFPCRIIKSRLLNTHRGDPRFAYRHEILETSPQLLEIGLEKYLQFQKDRWTCPSCGGQVLFHRYSCRDCGLENISIGQEFNEAGSGSE